jgi:hypothetical protein
MSVSGGDEPPGNEKRPAPVYKTETGQEAKCLGHPAMTTILYDATRTVKPARRFGAGLLATRPAYTAPFTASESAWWAAESARVESARFDRLAGESAALDLMEAGISCC